MNDIDNNQRELDLAAENARMAEDYSRRQIAERISEDRVGLAEAARGENHFTDAYQYRLQSIFDSLRNIPYTNQYKQDVLNILANHKDAIDEWSSIANEYSYTPEVPADRL